MILENGYLLRERNPIGFSRSIQTVEQSSVERADSTQDIQDIGDSILNRSAK